MLADLRPALLWPLPSTCPGPSLRCRFGGRTGVGAGPFVVGGLEGWRGAAEGVARFADMDGDGDEREVMTPLVWMPGGMGRLSLVGAGATGAATTVGAIAGASCCPGAAMRGESAMAEAGRFPDEQNQDVWSVCGVV